MQTYKFNFEKLCVSKKNPTNLMTEVNIVYTINYMDTHIPIN